MYWILHFNFQSERAMGKRDKKLLRYLDECGIYTKVIYEKYQDHSFFIARKNICKTYCLNTRKGYILLVAYIT